MDIVTLDDPVGIEPGCEPNMKLARIRISPRGERNSEAH